METRPRLTLNRQQLAVPPEILRTLRNVVSGDLDGLVVVDRLERTETAIADVGCERWKHRLAEVTLQADECGVSRRSECIRGHLPPSSPPRVSGAKAGIGT